jgi:hypothetical protein
MPLHVWLGVLNHGNTMKNSDIHETIELSPVASDIDADRAKFTLSGYIGSTLTEADNSTCSATFLDGFNQPTGKTTIDSGGRVDGLFLGTATELVPAHTRSVKVEVEFIHASDFDNNGAADSLSLVI